MLKSLLSTTSLNLINVTLVSFGLLSANVAKGKNYVTTDQYNEQEVNQSANHIYGPSIELSSRNSSKRKLAELDYMQPFFSNVTDLGIIDLKLKGDNNKSKEVNLGAVYRHNFNDNLILGVYGYYDYRRTGAGLSVSGFTPGVEMLSKYVDFRANYYLPQDKRKKTKHNPNKEVKIQGTSIYAVSGGHTYEYALRGYDVEIGASVFAFSDDLNDKFGTKIFVAHYDFKHKNTKSITGNRLRFEQNLGKLQLGDNSLQFKLAGETQYDKVRKRQNFISVGAKFTFGDNGKFKKPGLSNRMMDTVVRDVDIVETQAVSDVDISSFNWHGKEINQLVFVAPSNKEGNGTKENPYTPEQASKINLDKAIVVALTGDRPATAADNAIINNFPNLVNREGFVELVSNSNDQAKVKIDATNGVTLSSSDQSTKIVTNIKGQKVSTTENSVILASYSESNVHNAPRTRAEQPVENVRGNPAEDAAGREEVRVAAERRAEEARVEAERRTEEARRREEARAEAERIAREIEERELAEEIARIEEATRREEARVEAERVARDAEARRAAAERAETERVAREARDAEARRVEAERLAAEATRARDAAADATARAETEARRVEAERRAAEATTAAEEAATNERMAREARRVEAERRVEEERIAREAAAARTAAEVEAARRAEEQRVIRERTAREREVARIERERVEEERIARDPALRAAAEREAQERIARQRRDDAAASLANMQVLLTADPTAALAHHSAAATEETLEDAYLELKAHDTDPAKINNVVISGGQAYTEAKNRLKALKDATIIERTRVKAEIDSVALTGNADQDRITNNRNQIKLLISESTIEIAIKEAAERVLKIAEKLQFAQNKNLAIIPGPAEDEAPDPRWVEANNASRTAKSTFNTAERIYQESEESVAETKLALRNSLFEPNDLNNRFNSNVNVDTLDTKTSEIHNLILKFNNLVAAADSKEFKNDKDYKAVKAIFDTNPLMKKVELKAAIDNASISDSKKSRYRTIAEKGITSYNDMSDYAVRTRNEAANRDIAEAGDDDQNVGPMDGLGAKDSTLAFSTHRMQDRYGITPIKESLDLFEEIILYFIKNNVSAANITPEQADLLRTNPGQAAKNAATLMSPREYIGAVNEHARLYERSLQLARGPEKTALLNAMRPQQDIIDRYQNSEYSSTNLYLAAYRALDRMKPNLFTDNFYTEQPTGRFESKEIATLNAKASLDVAEILYNGAANKGKLPTEQEVLNTQLDNLKNYILAWGETQRRYKQHDLTGKDIGNTLLDRYGSDANKDKVACPHGTCQTLAERGFYAGNRLIEMNDSSPASFSDEFSRGVRIEIRDNMTTEVRDIVQNFLDTQDLSATKVELVNNSELKFSIKEMATDNYVEVPVEYSAVLNKVTAELNNRYMFLHPSPNARLFKQNDAFAQIKNFSYIPVN